MNKKRYFFRGLIATFVGALTPAIFAQAPAIDNTEKKWVGKYIVDGLKGTVTNPGRGLVWDRCALGQSGTDCATGNADSLSLADALAAASALGSYKGFNDWRLPSLDELEELARDYRSAPEIGDLAFPLTPASKFWTLQPACCGINLTWQVNFSNGSSSFDVRTNANRVRVVRVAK